LKRWITQYEETGSIKRQHRKPISYKITHEQVKYATQLLRKDQQISMHELVKQIKQKYTDFNITPQWLGKILRDNNKTRKRTRHKHFPSTRRKKPTNQKKELLTFYKKINTFPISKIISVDESSIKPFMMKEYSRCDIGKRCIAKTDENIVFRSYTLLVAISNKKCIGWVLYEKGGTTKERFVEFLQEYIFRHYKNHLIVMDNAGSHRNSYVWNAIEKSGNQYLHSIPYTPKTNPIEMWFNQVKHYLKLNKTILTYPNMKIAIRKAITYVKPINYKNYFSYAYQKEQLKLPTGTSTRRRSPKNYKK
tara:strand:- start:2299 stop:3216 length:918 start_codon:yes stop_codon:yes gene_type:complete